ncbi:MULTISPECIES: hypothetical protein [Arthrobacter]|jgi:hypothetical protein|uniref:hypothetical protein n=1 Tax=Arthrobacter TaxID=1663 RepID=UPI000971862A|nr:MULTISPECIES: hypothetical protein [Arthrobacter]APX01075.1 hypothetical protein BWQ92_04455 [Arthrobacter sp. QXT-31]
MDATQFDLFVAEALTTERETDTVLGPDELYGLYTSWCLIHKAQPDAAGALFVALRERGIDPENCEMAMTGPAAADYILASAPSLI